MFPLTYSKIAVHGKDRAVHGGGGGGIYRPNVHVRSRVSIHHVMLPLALVLAPQMGYTVSTAAPNLSKLVRTTTGVAVITSQWTEYPLYVVRHTEK
jgi:hypothetical protein